MREILFRGKEIVSGEWFYGYYDFHIIFSKDFYGSFIDDGEGQICQVDTKSVGQFTGLKDKNGTKIFENDIVKFKLDKYYIGIVKFGNILLGSFDKYNGWYVCIKEGIFYTNMKLVDAEIFEVIGNIHDNPEFLKEE